MTPEISRHIWYTITGGANLEERVKRENPKRSPLRQGGLEIIMDVTVSWYEMEKMDILRKWINGFPFDEDYRVDSKAILAEPFASGNAVQEESYSNCDFEE